MEWAPRQERAGKFDPGEPLVEECCLGEHTLVLHDVPGGRMLEADPDRLCLLSREDPDQFEKACHGEVRLHAVRAGRGSGKFVREGGGVEPPTKREMVTVAHERAIADSGLDGVTDSRRVSN